MSCQAKRKVRLKEVSLKLNNFTIRFFTNFILRGIRRGFVYNQISLTNDLQISLLKALNVLFDCPMKSE